MAGSSSSARRKMKSSRTGSARGSALEVLQRVFEGQSLAIAKLDAFEKLDDRERALMYEIINGVLRWRWRLDYYMSCLLSKPIKKKDSLVLIVLLMALYELTECRTPDYAIINEAVELVKQRGKHWAASLVNAVLRRFTRERGQLQAGISEDAARYSHPDWLLSKIRDDWPKHWQAILEANNQRPPFWLRVNRLHHTAAEYQSILESEDISSHISDITVSALRLDHGVDVKKLPGFSEGEFSVQDAGAQLSADLLSLSGGQRVLDLCCAPGGKTSHILESCPSLASLTAVELDANRMKRVEENLSRLGFIDSDKETDKVELLVADASDYRSWWNGEAYDRILIDAPCSASGVIRRHPDIKSLRQEEDIQPLVELQGRILDSAWRMLKPGGELLYVTCSLFRDENENQMHGFFAVNEDAEEIEIGSRWGVACAHGRQLLPGQFDADGFYFCKLRKRSSR